MAIDPKARRAAVHYPKGRVTACLGLLEEVFGANDISNPAEVTIDVNGRRRLSNLIRMASAVGGKQVVVEMKSGETYQLHYSGTLVDFVLGAVPKMDASKVLSWNTVRGLKQYVN